jgi:para-aminobenzoate synthetase / 4-amino-4-deoxychorismate lyase
MSPELFLRRTGTSVLSQPIKGTRLRPDDQAAARRQREKLERSVKDQAENVMIVDLMRNDLSRVCAPGSVAVPALLRAQAHPGVWHLVSDVCGTLRPGTDDGQLIRATFPPGSVTGAPKIRALEIIHELETTPREVYTGAIGYRSPVAGLELNVAIRTFEFHRGRVWLGSGGGITAGSDADAEYRECLVKASPLISALGARLTESALPSPPRPRPAMGVFTSLRVAGGRGHDLDAHIARLDESARQLFGKQLPPGLPAELAACLASGLSGRLRISARPVGGPLQVTVEVVPTGATPATVALHPVVIPGGLGAHKWQDRRLLIQASERAGLGEEEHLLILDANEDVLETDRANIFAVIHGVLHTPPADGRLLPGITRAAVLRLAAREGLQPIQVPVSARLLAQASEVFVTNSVHGIMPVRSLAAMPRPGTGPAGTDLAWPTGPVSPRLQAALTRRPANRGGPDIPPPSRARPQRALRRGSRPAIILVDNYDSFTYNLAHMLLGNGCDVEVTRNDEVSAQEIAAFGPGRHRHLARPRHPRRRRNQHRCRPRLRPRHAAARHLPGAPGHRRRLRRDDHDSGAGPRPGLARYSRRPRPAGRAASVSARRPLPLADRRRGHAAPGPDHHRPRPRRNPDGTTARRPPPGRGPAVPPRIHPHPPRGHHNPQLHPGRPRDRRARPARQVTDA